MPSTLYQVADVNNHEEAKKLFEAFNIPYEVAASGRNKGKLLVKKIRASDSNAILQMCELLTRNGLGSLCDHANVFRDADDWPVVTFSPYLSIPYREYELPGYEVIVSELSIYSYGTPTVVVRSFRR